MAELTQEQKPDFKTARNKAIYGGLVGLDRFYLGDKGLGVGKLILTCLSLGLYTVPWWVTDIVIISSHKNDWNKYIADKLAKRAQRQAAHQAALNQRALAVTRQSSGKCPRCGSEKLQIVTETKSTSGSQGSRGCCCCLIPSIPAVSGKTTGTNKRMCMNCGNKF